MRRFTPFRWVAVLTLAIALAPSAASAQEADTLSISGTFGMDSLGGTVGADLAQVYANGHDHTWTLTLYGVSYSHFHSGGYIDAGYYDYDETYATYVHATSLDFEFFGPDAEILNSVFSPQLTSGGLYNGAIFWIANYYWEYSYYSEYVWPPGSYDYAEGQFGLSLRSDDPLEGVTTFNCSNAYTDLWTLFPVDENGYPVVQPQNLIYYSSSIGDSRSQKSGSLNSHLGMVVLGSSEPPVLPPPPPPLPTLSIADGSVLEGKKGTRRLHLNVTLSWSSSDVVTVSYATADGTALAKSDYTATSGTLTFQPGQTSGTISISIKGDREREPDETFSVQLWNAVGATIDDGFATATIVNDD